jgi:hypothetical protein
MVLKKLLIAAAALGFAAAASADVYEASFEGNWYNPAQNGRGVAIDYVPQDLGNGTYYIVSFTYDAQGNPTWLQYLASGKEGQRLFKNVDVFRVTGGTPGATFPPLSSIVATKVGTATVDIASCSKITVDFVPLSSSNIPALFQSLTRLDSPGVGSSSCPFEKEFTGCPVGTTAVANADRVCEIPGGTVTGDVRLTNTASYRLGGRVAIGGAMDLTTGAVATNTGRLFVEPGTIVRGNDSSASRLIINPGSKIFAEGTPTAPIVFTGQNEIPDAQQSPGAWAGLIIAGRAPINEACTGGRTNTSCAFEADSAIVWGGNDANDSSGVLKYVQVRSAGGIITGSIDLNAITLGAVGAGTAIDYVQAYRSTDDGFEMFGGTVNLRHIVAVGNNDDNIDTDFGYTGKIQYAYVKMSEGIDPLDSHGIESDNTSGNPFKPDSIPRTRPTLVNATFDGAGLGVDGIRIRRGSAYVLQNVVVTGFKFCLNFNDTATYDATFAGGAFNGTTVVNGAYFSCTNNFDDQSVDPFLLSTFFSRQAENVAATNANGLFNANGRTLLPTSPLRNSNQSNSDAFFERYGAKGAFIDGDWTKGWTIGL